MALAANEHLEDLEISDNALGDNGIQCLKFALRVNKCLSRCHLTSLGAESLGRVLSAINQCLKELNLSGNENFGDDGIKHLA